MIAKGDKMSEVVVKASLQLRHLKKSITKYSYEDYKILSSYYKGIINKTK